MEFPLEKLKSGFECRDLDEELIKNADETHIVSDMDNEKTVEMHGNEYVKYTEVVSRDEGITMMVRITGGTVPRSRH